jgi:hypothetical protein
MAGAFATDTPDEFTLTPKGRYLTVAMMRTMFANLNGLRDSARAGLPADERRLLFGDGAGCAPTAKEASCG